MTYHLPRIEYWLQNGNLNHYYTSITRQLFSAPFAESVILYGRALTGDDWLANLVQWFSFLGAIIVISKISAHLGLSKKMQILSALFFATTPIVILEATSTQNDLVVAFWLLCLLERFLAWQKGREMCLSLEIGLALGLAILTKGTAYPIALPIVLLYAFICLKEYRKYLLGAICTAAICLAINMPHYLRNYNTFQNPIEAYDSTVSSFTLKAFALSSFSNVYSNIPVPLLGAEYLNEKLKAVENEIYPFGPLQVSSIARWKSKGDLGYYLEELLHSHEDTVKNPFHALLILVSIIFILYNISVPLKMGRVKQLIK